jgi:alanyl-tRNA synthetase
LTERLYYDDSYITEFRANVIERGDAGRRVYLDRTAFYPASGGQPFDTGRINGVSLVEVLDEGERIAHLTGAPVEADEVECRIDWPRRFDHMQQHSGQHLLSAVLVELCGISTLSFHLGNEVSTIDIGASALEAERVRAVERRVNEVVFENRPISVAYEHSSEDLQLRKPSEREGTLRIVSIDRLDRSACGGTHVRSTGEIGPVLIRKHEKVRGKVRIEFLCGLRAVERARADYEALSQIGRLFSAALDETPALVAAQIEKLRETEKVRRRLAIELAQAKGRELYQQTAAGAAGKRRHVRRIASGAIDEELRAEAQAFVAGPNAVFVALLEAPPAILLAVSADSGIHAGNTLKEAFARLGGRGGGNAQVGQGSLPAMEALEQLRKELEDLS